VTQYTPGDSEARKAKALAGRSSNSTNALAHGGSRGLKAAETSSPAAQRHDPRIPSFEPSPDAPKLEQQDGLAPPVDQRRIGLSTTVVPQPQPRLLPAAAGVEQGTGAGAGTGTGTGTGTATGTGTGTATGIGSSYSRSTYVSLHCNAHLSDLDVEAIAVRIRERISRARRGPITSGNTLGQAPPSEHVAVASSEPLAQSSTEAAAPSEHTITLSSKQVVRQKLLSRLGLEHLLASAVGSTSVPSMSAPRSIADRFQHASQQPAASASSAR